MTTTGGETRPAGALKLELNPPKPDKDVEVKFEGAWVRAELDGDNLTVRVSGQASYLKRTVTQTIDLAEELPELKAALGQILEAYDEAIKTVVLHAAFEGYAVAKKNGEVK